VSTLQNLAGLTISNAPERVIVNFGTGRQIPQTVTTAAQYASGSQYLYGIWDWDMVHWNNISPVQQAVSLKAPQTISGPASASPNLQRQVITTIAATGSLPSYRTLTHNPVCWAGGSGCTPASSFGWYMQLPATGEQIIFDPVLSPDGELVVNTFIPTSSSPLDCKASLSSGFSMGMLPDSGAGSPTAYFNVSSGTAGTNGTTGITADGVQLNGVGIPALLSSGQKSDQNAEYFITQTGSGAAAPIAVNRHVIVTGARLNYLQRR
jgi:type IV pilus assembly protein PilY1